MSIIHYDYGTIITEAESVLCISSDDFKLRDMSVLSTNVKRRLNLQYGIDIGEIGVTGFENNSNINLLLDILKGLHCKLAGMGNYYRFLGNTPIDLKSINYLGLTKESLMAALVVFQKEGSSSRVTGVVSQIEERLVSINATLEKRLFILLVVTHNLKLYEISAVIAELLYLGGV